MLTRQAIPTQQSLPSAARLQRCAPAQRRCLRKTCRAEGGVGSYLAEAASQIFSPTDNDTPWSSSGFSGRITHHEEVSRLRHLYNEVRQAREAIEGCTDPKASNYDPSATSDDGSCAVVLSDSESTNEGTESLRSFVVGSLKRLWGSNFDSAGGEDSPFKGTTYSWSGDKPVSQRDISRLLNYERTVKQALDKAESSEI